jgi:hypothetical protein
MKIYFVGSGWIEMEKQDALKVINAIQENAALQWYSAVNSNGIICVINVKNITYIL